MAMQIINPSASMLSKSMLVAVVQCLIFSNQAQSKEVNHQKTVIGINAMSKKV
jgi:hypothetical protein